MKNNKNIGYGLIIVGILLIIVGGLTGNSADSKIDNDYPNMTAQEAADAGFSDSAGGDIEKRWTCGTEDPVEVGRKLRDEIRPQAYQENSGFVYMRTSKKLYIVQNTGAGGQCMITREDIGGRRYSGGHFIYLGPGFGPSSPAGGSGGSAGSFGGAK